MATPVIVHVIGSAALMAILIIVLIMASSITATMMYNNKKYNLEATAESVGLQIKYALQTLTNLSIVLDYPLEIAYETEYNIIIGNGSTLNSRYSVLPQLDPNNIYVVAITPDETVYGYYRIANTTYNGYQIVIVDGYKIFGSRFIVRVDFTIVDNTIYMNITKLGVKRP